jgi:tetratricopeptide (TPR) repeat protein
MQPDEAAVYDLCMDLAKVNHAWLEESKRQTPAWPAHLAAYGRMAGQAQAGAIVISQYAVTSCAESSLMNISMIPPLHYGCWTTPKKFSNPTLRSTEHRAKIFYRRKDHEAALRLFWENAGQMELREPAARAYMLREAALSAAELGEWAEAREWFAAARQVDSNAASTNMKLMVIGLRADEALAAYQAGDLVAALNGLDTALDEIAPVDPAGSIAAAPGRRDRSGS